MFVGWWMVKARHAGRDGVRDTDRRKDKERNVSGEKRGRDGEGGRGRER